MYASESARCPFYIKSGKIRQRASFEIYCEGLYSEEDAIILRCADEICGEYHVRKHCKSEKGFNCCPIYKMLCKEKYEID